MSDVHHNVRMAVRTALVSLVKATTGARTDLSLVKVDAQTARVQRLTGSFVVDGFSAGDYVLSSGWPKASLNGDWYVIGVSDLTLTLRAPADVDHAIANVAAGSTVTLTAGAVPASSMADEGFLTDQATGQTWWRESYKGGPQYGRSLLTVTNASQAPKRLVRLDWLYMLSVFYPNGVGTAGIDGMYGAVFGVLYPSKVLTYNSQATTIINVSRQGIVTQTNWISVPISVRGFAYTFTP